MVSQVRKHFYRDATDAMQLALGAGRSRIRLKCVIPELNVETDGAMLTHPKHHDQPLPSALADHH